MDPVMFPTHKAAEGVLPELLLEHSLSLVLPHLTRGRAS